MGLEVREKEVQDLTQDIPIACFKDGGAVFKDGKACGQPAGVESDPR